MVINNGFNFTNAVFENCWIEKDKIMFSGNYNFIKIYNTFSTENVLLDFLSINIENDNSILNFITKYGFILNIISTNNDSSSATVGIHIDDDLIQEKNIELNGNKVSINLSPMINKKQFYFTHDLFVFKHYHARIKSTVELMAAIKSKELSTILINTLFLALDQQPLEMDLQYSKSYSLSCDLDFFSSMLNKTSQAKQEQINSALQSLIEPQNDLVFPFFIEILHELKNICRIEAITNEEKIIFNKDIDLITDLLPSQICDSLIILAREIVRSEINLNLTSVTPILTIDNANNFNGTWLIPNLLSALYLDIYLKQSNNTIYKKCNNPTCDLFFEVTPDNTVKKYCSTRCAQLMAKRKQRERDKNHSLK